MRGACAKVKRMLCLGLMLAATATQANVVDQFKSLFANAQWTQWQSFRDAFVTADGRVIDRSQADARTVSEAQGYALFFALVANDRKTFDTLLTWTENNLSQGDLSKHLPAWLWAKKGDAWGVQDPNSASDADLWIAYALLEASKRWCHAPYETKARALSDRILNEETLEVEGLGLSLLPGKTGFVASEGSVRLNPSYVPPFILARFANHWANDPRWAELYLGSQRLLIQSASQGGGYPDWVVYKNGQPEAFVEDPHGDFDAIRVYLWLGMTARSDPIRATLVQQQRLFLEQVTRKNAVPQSWEPLTRRFSNTAGPRGFQAALLPLAASEGMKPLSSQLIKKTLQHGTTQAWVNQGYYNSVLTLFASGHSQGLYSFDARGAFQAATKGRSRCE